MFWEVVEVVVEIEADEGHPEPPFRCRNQKLFRKSDPDLELQLQPMRRICLNHEERDGSSWPSSRTVHGHRRSVR